MQRQHNNRFWITNCSQVRRQRQQQQRQRAHHPIQINGKKERINAPALFRWIIYCCWCWCWCDGALVSPFPMKSRNGKMNGVHLNVERSWGPNTEWIESHRTKQEFLFFFSLLLFFVVWALSSQIDMCVWAYVRARTRNQHYYLILYYRYVFSFDRRRVVSAIFMSIFSVSSLNFNQKLIYYISLADNLSFFLSLSLASLSLTPTYTLRTLTTL